MKNEKIHILLIDDDEDDFLLLKKYIGKIKYFSCQLEWVDSYEAALSALKKSSYDISIIDYRLGKHTGLQILEFARESHIYKPFIMLTSLGDDELGAKAIQKGAEDYLIKGEITPPLLERSIFYSIERSKARQREYELLQEQLSMQAMQQSEKRFKSLIENTYDVIVLSDIKGNYFYATPSIERVIGYTPEEFIKLNGFNIIHPEDIKRIAKSFEKLISTPGITLSQELRGKCKDGDWRWFECTSTNLLHEPTIKGIVTNLHDVTERKILEQRKDEFIGIASHELKTPLTSIKGYTQILERIIDDKGNKKASTLLNKTNIYIDRLNALIADLLDVSKIQSGKLDFNMSSFDFHEVIQDTIENIQHTNTKHTISCDDCKNISVYADRYRIEQVLTNLLTNAIKYSPQSNKIHISITKNKNQLQVGVTDHGVGISKKDQDRLFQRFYRVEKTSTRFSGLGIGLYISSEIIRRHKGKIWVDSKEDKGSTFYFTLPIGN